MSKMNDREHAMKRKIKELEEKVSSLMAELKVLKSAKNIVKIEKKAEEIQAPKCPKCGAKVNKYKTHHATLELCAEACGYRQVK